MARAGARVVAVDLSTTLTAALERSLQGEPVAVRRRVTVKLGDMRSLHLGRTFRLVVAPSDTVSHLYTRSDVEGFLACARAHLAPSGRLVFDLAMPRLPSTDALAGTNVLGELSGAVERTDYDPVAQVLSIWCVFLDRSVLLARRLFFPRELELLLHHGGFGRVHLRAIRAEKSGQSARLRVSCQALHSGNVVAPC
jgi:hypothetical protein